MKKQIQLYYDPEDETYKTLISAKNKTYLLDVCYKFSVEFYKFQMKEVNPDSEEVICYLIAMMYLLRQGGSLPGIAARGVGSTGEWLQERVPSTDTHWPRNTHQSASTRQPTDTYQPVGGGQPMGMHQPVGAGQPMGMHQSAGTGQPMDMRQPTGIYQSADMQSSDMEQPTDVQAAYRYQADDGNKGDSQNWLADGNPALASVMADVEIK